MAGVVPVIKLIQSGLIFAMSFCLLIMVF